MTLSLNGSDALTGAEDAPLQSLGIVPGDLIKVLPPSAPAASAPAPQIAPSPKPQATSASGPKPSRMEGSSDGASGSSPSTTSSAKTGPPDRKVEESPVSLLIEAKDGCPPPSLVELFSKCSPSSPSQAVNLMVHLTMLECGFCSESNADPPPGWKEMVATIHYSHNTLPEFKCTLVLVTMGEIKQVMASFQQQESEISVKLLVGEYVMKENSIVNVVAPGKLIRVAQLARTLRNQLLHPLQVAAHQILGVPAPWHLAGLPQEVLLIIARNMDAKSVISLGQSCKRLHSVMEDNKLWQFLYKMDFKNLYESTGGLNNIDWKAKYKEAVIRRREWKRMQDDPNIKFEIPEFYPSPFGPAYPTYPGMPPRNPDPYPPQPPQPHPTPNPFYDPDSPFFMGEIPPMPGVFPNVPNPLNPLLPRGPRPNNPFVPPFMPTRPRAPRGPRFDYFSSDFI